MKLRNKKNGAIGIVQNQYDADGITIKDGNNEYTAYSVAQLVKEWEDYTDGFWSISNTGEVVRLPMDGIYQINIKKIKAIGLYFETKEEAEAAIKKAEAINRLKNKKIKIDNIFCSCYSNECSIHLLYDPSENETEIRNDLNIIFDNTEDE